MIAGESPLVSVRSPAEWITRSRDRAGEFLGLRDSRSAPDAERPAEAVTELAVLTADPSGRALSAELPAGSATTPPESPDSTVLRPADRHRAHRAGSAQPALLGQLRRAAAQYGRGSFDELHVVYQPIVELRPKAGRHPRRQLEALLRWSHPSAGTLPAAAFLDLAERSDLIIGIGDGVLRHALEVARAWQHPAFGSSVSINVSAAELSSPGFGDRVRGALRAAHASPSWLRIEVGERVLLCAGGRAAATMGDLADLGVRWSLDGVESPSSLPRLTRRFPVDTVKLGWGAVAGLADPVGAAEVGAVVFLARILGLDIAAQGVQTRRQLDQLTLLGCDRVQGRLLGRPRAWSAPAGTPDGS